MTNEETARLKMLENKVSLLSQTLENFIGMEMAPLQPYQSQRWTDLDALISMHMSGENMIQQQFEEDKLL
jgi:hypothetical protein